MGHILELDCATCGYKGRFFLGAGILYNNLEIMKKEFGDAPREEIEEWLCSHKADRFDANTVLAFCKKCRRFEEMLILTLYSSDEKKEFLNRCSVCENQMDKVPDGTVCFKCGSLLKSSNVGAWD